jgi:shikimate kinase
MMSEGGEQLRNIVLTGFMGTGKTSVGQVLARRLEWPYVDTDALVERMAGKAVADLIRCDGEAVFRRLERAACLEVAARRKQVVGTGGGALLDPKNRAVMLMDNLLVCLTCDAEEIARRLDGDDSRPLLDGDPVTRIDELLAARKTVYDALPHHVDTTRRTPEEVADAVLQLWPQT